MQILGLSPAQLAALISLEQHNQGFDTLRQRPDLKLITGNRNRPQKRPKKRAEIALIL
ncbi:hypothetical protein JCM17846_12830 [Iodidimonas nitroreducens]|uniref:Uncharacterized protein n=1 Tax=Iodidimonas nitroreducens TaxID=1236968 RepID=A0A5A7N5M5_9PROT|nr:hypothetical protein [Iodidimonas nitroreducens]GAK33684.1 hypothetical protein AQ1_01574 [alpha proteobacterium Q-1]GER03601.1 hypothetical protein JCM17846_12830 [Iodidimonas nitroreducens]